MPINSDITTSLDGEPLLIKEDLAYVLGWSWGRYGLGREIVQHQTDKHVLSIAPTRAGKGRGLILPNLLHLPNHSVFVIDPKGENALVSAQYRRDKLVVSHAETPG